MGNAGRRHRESEAQAAGGCFRFVSFRPFETFGPHKHLRIEINYVKKGNCILHLENESISFSENEMMVICSNVEHTFEAGSEDTDPDPVEFVPEVFSRFNPDGHGQMKESGACHDLFRRKPVDQDCE